MTIQDKFIFLIIVFFTIPLLVAALFNRIGKHGFLDGFLLSLVSMIIMSTALEVLGSRILDDFIRNDLSKLENSILSSMKIVSLFTLLCLGGSSFISRIHKAITGEDLNIENIEKFKKDISATVAIVSNKSDSIAKMITSGKEMELIQNPVAMLDFLSFVQQHPLGVKLDEIPEKFNDCLNNASLVNAIHASIDEVTFETLLKLTDTGNELLKPNQKNE